MYNFIVILRMQQKNLNQVISIEKLVSDQHMIPPSHKHIDPTMCEHNSCKQGRAWPVTSNIFHISIKQQANTNIEF